MNKILNVFLLSTCVLLSADAQKPDDVKTEYPPVTCWTPHVEPDSKWGQYSSIPCFPVSGFNLKLYGQDDAFHEVPLQEIWKSTLFVIPNFLRFHYDEFPEHKKELLSFFRILLDAGCHDAAREIMSHFPILEDGTMLKYVSEYFGGGMDTYVFFLSTHSSADSAAELKRLAMNNDHQARSCYFTGLLTGRHGVQINKDEFLSYVAIKDEVALEIYYDALWNGSNTFDQDKDFVEELANQGDGCAQNTSIEAYPEKEDASLYAEFSHNCVRRGWKAWTMYPWLLAGECNDSRQPFFKKDHDELFSLAVAGHEVALHVFVELYVESKLKLINPQILSSSNFLISPNFQKEHVDVTSRKISKILHHISGYNNLGQSSVLAEDRAVLVELMKKCDSDKILAFLKQPDFNNRLLQCLKKVSTIIASDVLQ